MKVLVTGNLGYVGSVAAPFLAARGHEVCGLDTGFYRDCRLLPVTDPPTIQRDVRDAQRADLAGFDAVVHLAALSNDPMGELDPALTDEINHKATVCLAELARAAGVKRFVLASSCSMYGVAGGAAVTEEAAFNPQSAYARSKVDAETGLRSLATDAFSPVCLRFSTAYGLSPRLRFDLVANNLTGWAMTTGAVKITSDGTPWRPLVHVEDMARAMAAALDSPRQAIHNEALNIGREEDNYQVRDIAEVVHRIVGNCQVQLGGQGGADTRSYRVSFVRVGRLLPQFAPAWSLETGVRNLHAALARVKIDEAGFQSAAYTRLKRLKELMTDGRLDASLRWCAAAVGA